MDTEKRLRALEGRVAILEAALGAVLAGDDDDDKPAPAEDMEGNPLPRRAAGGW